MRKASLVAAFLVAFMFATAALAGGGVSVDPNNRFEFTNCAAGGSSSQNVVAGTYLLRITDEDTWVCWAGTCAANGERFPVGFAMLIVIGQSPQSGVTAMSCRSVGATGDFILTRAN